MKRLADEKPPKHGVYRVKHEDGREAIGRWHHGHFHAHSEDKRLEALVFSTDSELAHVEFWDYLQNEP